MPGRSGFSDAVRGELLRLQATDKPHCGGKGSGLELGELDLQATDMPHCGGKESGLELGELDLQVADKPVNLAHTHPTMLSII